jgi:hypothetical protein
MEFDELSNRVIGCAKGIHEAPPLTYMKLAGVKIGLLIHFRESLLRRCFRWSRPTPN